MVFEENGQWYIKGKSGLVTHGPFKCRREARAANPDKKMNKVLKVPVPPPTTTSQPSSPPTKLKRNYIAVLVDASDSMAHLTKNVQKSLDETLKTLQERTPGQENFVAVLSFGSSMQWLTKSFVRASDIRDVVYRNAYSNTRLIASVRDVVQEMDRVHCAVDADVAFLVITITDGEDNSSYPYARHDFARDVAKWQARGNMTFAFAMPRGKADRFSSDYGVPRGNCTEWEQTAQGTRDLGVHTNCSLRTFSDSRAAGASAVASFYVTTDLSKVTAKDIAAKGLTDLAARFKGFTVEKEVDVKTFVETKTRRPYVLGSAYYTLMKRETVQPQKAVLVCEKGKTAVWGGAEARALVGLPQGSNAEVTPGNHSNYDVFVQSTSINRKLPRGTKVLVDMGQTQPLPSTW